MVAPVSFRRRHAERQAGGNKCKRQQPSHREFSGKQGYPCDPRQGRIPGATHVEVSTLFAGPGQPKVPDDIRALVGLPEGAEIVAYCHSGSRSALAVLALRSAGYNARNYAGSWHEWSRHAELPLER